MKNNATFHLPIIIFFDEIYRSTSLINFWVCDLTFFKSNKKMPHFVVHVEEARKILISSRILKVDTNLKTFNDIFEQLTAGQFGLHQVEVYVGKGDTRCIFVQDGLKDELSLMSTFAYTHIKFVIRTEEELPVVRTSTSAATTHFNAFNRLMQNSRQQLSLPSFKTEDNQHNLLYNDIIRLFQQKKC